MDNKDANTSTKKKNKIVAIGWRGIKKCYLNVTKLEAAKRYCVEEDIPFGEFMGLEIPIDVIEFDSEFGAYDIWE